VPPRTPGYGPGSARGGTDLLGDPLSHPGHRLTAVDVMIGFAAELWEWTGKAAWFFVTLPVDDAEDIRECVPERRGFGSVRVEAQIGASTWKTSIFPDSSSGSYVLPVKRAIRDAEGVEAGDTVDVTLRVLLDPRSALG
jgi:hypothetical protein